MTALVCARSESIPHPASLEYSVLDEKSNLHAEAIVLDRERNRTLWERTQLPLGSCTYIADNVGVYWIYAPERRNGPGEGQCDVGCDDEAERISRRSTVLFL